MDRLLKAHAWTEYPNGTAHCPACGAGRQPDGTVIIGGLPSCEPQPTRRVVDGVIVDDDPPQYSRPKK